MTRGKSDSDFQCKASEEYEMSKVALWLRHELEKTILHDREHGYVSEEEMKRRFGR